MQKGMTPLKMDPKATVDNHKLVSASEGLLPSHRLEGIKTNYCNCTGPDCLTLSCPCFSTGFLCSETCNCQVCGNALDIKPGIEMTLEEIDSKYPCPDVLKDVICTCEKDGCTKMCTGCSMSCQYYAKLNPFEKKKIRIENPIESANSSLAFNSTDDGTNQRLSFLKQQIGFANPLTLDQRVERGPELSKLHSQQQITSIERVPESSKLHSQQQITSIERVPESSKLHSQQQITSIERVPESSKLHSQQQITTYISPYTSSQSMMRNPTVPQCSNQQLNPANSLLINQRVPRILEFYLIPEQKKINSIFPQSFRQKIEPNNSLPFNQTVPKVPELHHFGSQQKITSTSPATFNPPTRSSSSYSNNFNAKSYYEELCLTKKLPYKDCEQDATMIVHKNRTSKKCTSQNTKKPSKVSLNGCLCQMFSCAQRNCKCLKYGASCSDQCKCSNCQNPHGKRNAADIH